MSLVIYNIHQEFWNQSPWNIPPPGQCCEVNYGDFLKLVRICRIIHIIYLTENNLLKQFFLYFLWFFHIQAGITPSHPSLAICHRAWQDKLGSTKLLACSWQKRAKAAILPQKTRQTLIPNITVVSRPHPRYICQYSHEFRVKDYSAPFRATTFWKLWNYVNNRLF